MAHDPEVQALTAQVAVLTRQALRLSRDINGALEELQEFTSDISGFRDELERRRMTRPYHGRDRRGTGRRGGDET